MYYFSYTLSSHVLATACFEVAVSWLISAGQTGIYLFHKIFIIDARLAVRSYKKGYDQESRYQEWHVVLATASSYTTRCFLAVVLI